MFPVFYNNLINNLVPGSKDLFGLGLWLLLLILIIGGKVQKVSIPVNCNKDIHKRLLDQLKEELYDVITC